MQTDVIHSGGRAHVLVRADTIAAMAVLPSKSIDVIVTSPPYNVGVKYNAYNDRLKIKHYLGWLALCAVEFHRLLKHGGSLFLNVGGTPTQPWLPFQVARIFRGIFRLQNTIIWAKSITVGEESYGHFRPIRSRRFVNSNWELLLHLTHSGDVSLDRLAVGVPYADPANEVRWQTPGKKRCGGNVWFIPYPTRNRREKHPATFPPELPERCIRLHGVGPDGIVLDPFSGLGNTAIAAVRCGVNSICVELDEEYHREAIQRVRSAQRRTP